MVSSTDVARAAGVSRTAVSRVLNGHANAGIPEETRNRILKAAKDLGYVPNASAKALATGRTNRFSIITGQPTTMLGQIGYFGLVLRGILSRAIELELDILLHGKSGVEWEPLFEDLKSGVSDGALLIARNPPDPLVAALDQTNIPAVCVSYRQPDHSSYVDCDNRQGGFLAGAHLLEVGCDSIATISQPNADYQRERILGIQDAVGDLYVGNFTDPDEVHLLLRRRNQRLGLVGTYDLEAWPIFEYLFAAGLRPPRHYAAIIFDDTPAPEEQIPPMTFIDQPLDFMGRSAVDLLVQRLSDPQLPVVPVVHPMRLNKRASTSRL